MKFLLAAFAIISILGCATSPTSTSSNSTVSVEKDPIIGLDKGLNTLLDQVKKPELNPNGIKMATELLNLVTSAKRNGPPNLKVLPADQQVESKKEYEDIMIFLEKDIQAYLDALKENDNELAREFVYRAVQTIKLVNGPPPSDD